MSPVVPLRSKGRNRLELDRAKGLFQAVSVENDGAWALRKCSRLWGHRPHPQLFSIAGFTHSSKSHRVEKGGGTNGSFSPSLPEASVSDTVCPFIFIGGASVTSSCCVCGGVVVGGG